MLDALLFAAPWTRRSSWFRHVGWTPKARAEMRAGLAAVVAWLRAHWQYGFAMVVYEYEMRKMRIEER